MSKVFSIGTEKVFKPCADCTCTPGLLWRQGRKKSQLFRKMSNSRKGMNFGDSKSGSNESIYSSDTIWQAKSVSTGDRLLALRKQMAKHNLCCYIVPSEDEHQSEYVSTADERRAFISGFTGSAGVACISRNILNFNESVPEGKAILSTDARYFAQAMQELDSNWSLLRQGYDKLTWQQWCINEAAEMSRSLGGKPARIGIDPKLITYENVVRVQSLIDEKLVDSVAVVQFIPISDNLIDLIWSEFENKPTRTLNSLLLLEHRYSGESYKSKRHRLMEYMNENYSGSKNFLVVALDEICWFLNLRGSDILYNPVFYSFLLLQGESTTLFASSPISEEIGNYFQENNIKVKKYDEIWDILNETAKSLAFNKDTVLIPDSSSWELMRCLSDTKIKRVHSPLSILKAVKNEFEIGNARAAQVKDAVCLAQYFSWLEEEILVKEKLIDEYKAALKLLEIRKCQKHFMGNSFCTISSTGPNTAIIHYSPPEECSAMICPYKIYLCDSGSQFMEGTTDITRTLHFTDPTQEECDSYTLVLKGNLALERMVFPDGTPGSSIDAIARQFLWKHGLDYGHGTGHGIGSFLNVHEGPVSISPCLSRTPYSLKAGNIISNEPGYYKDGAFGVRIENDMLVVESELPSFGKKKFLKFENITLVPYCRKLINVKLLTKQEKVQINEYYERIWRNIVPFLQPQSITYKWLKRETAPF